MCDDGKACRSGHVCSSLSVQDEVDRGEAAERAYSSRVHHPPTALGRRSPRDGWQTRGTSRAGKPSHHAPALASCGAGHTPYQGKIDPSRPATEDPWQPVLATTVRTQHYATSAKEKDCLVRISPRPGIKRGRMKASRSSPPTRWAAPLRVHTQRCDNDAINPRIDSLKKKKKLIFVLHALHWPVQCLVFACLHMIESQLDDPSSTD